MSVEYSFDVPPSSAAVPCPGRMLAQEEGRHQNAGFCRSNADESNGNGFRRFGIARQRRQELVREVAVLLGFGNAFNPEAQGKAVALPINAYVPYAPADSLGEWVSMNPKGV